MNFGYPSPSPSPPRHRHDNSSSFNHHFSTGPRIEEDQVSSFSPPSPDHFADISFSRAATSTPVDGHNQSFFENPLTRLDQLNGTFADIDIAHDEQDIIPNDDKEDDFDEPRDDIMNFQHMIDISTDMSRRYRSSEDVVKKRLGKLQTFLKVGESYRAAFESSTFLPQNAPGNHPYYNSPSYEQYCLYAIVPGPVLGWLGREQANFPGEMRPLLTHVAAANGLYCGISRIISKRQGQHDSLYKRVLRMNDSDIENLDQHERYLLRRSLVYRDSFLETGCHPIITHKKLVFRKKTVALYAHSSENDINLVLSLCGKEADNFSFNGKVRPRTLSKNLKSNKQTEAWTASKFPNRTAKEIFRCTRKYDINDLMMNLMEQKDLFYMG